MIKRNHYDREFKIQAVKLALEVGQSKACNELNLPENTIYSWMHSYRQSRPRARHANARLCIDDERGTG